MSGIFGGPLSLGGRLPRSVDQTAEAIRQETECPGLALALAYEWPVEMTVFMHACDRNAVAKDAIDAIADFRIALDRAGACEKVSIGVSPRVFAVIAENFSGLSLYSKMVREDSLRHSMTLGVGIRVFRETDHDQR